MTLAAQIVSTNALAVLKTRAEIRAYLFAEGELDLHDAVDELQASAVRVGLVDEIGQDAVQKILSDAFAPYRGGADA